MDVDFNNELNSSDSESKSESDPEFINWCDRAVQNARDGNKEAPRKSEEAAATSPVIPEAPEAIAAAVDNPTNQFRCEACDIDFAFQSLLNVHMARHGWCSDNYNRSSFSLSHFQVINRKIGKTLWNAKSARWASSGESHWMLIKSSVGKESPTEEPRSERSMIERPKDKFKSNILQKSSIHITNSVKLIFIDNSSLILMKISW